MKKQKSFTPHLLEGKKERISSKPLKKGEGFTLIELMVVISIIGLISSIVLVSVKSAREKAKITAGLQFSSSVHHALGAYAVGIWDFDESAGATSFKDYSGYNNDGSCSGASCPTSGVSDTPSGKGYALSFNGSNNWVNTGPNDTLNISTGITISAWTKGYRMIVSNGTQYGVFIDPSGGNRRVRYWYWGATSGGWVNYYTNFGTVSPDKWSHVAVVNVPGPTGMPLPKIYVNGKEQTVNGSSPQQNNAGGGNRVYIGEYSVYRPYSPFNGLIDDVRIYEEALSDAQIKQLYAEGANLHGHLAEEK